MAEDPVPATTQEPAARGPAARQRGRGPVARHPVTSFLIALLVTASIAGVIGVPIYDSLTPYVGDFPFFYFYLLVYMPAAAIALWVVSLLQRRLKDGPR